MKKSLFSLRKNLTSLFIFLSYGILFTSSRSALAASGVTLYTPYSKITVPPEESISYSIDVINKSSEIQNVEISLEGLPRGWNYTLRSGGWNISEISVLPGEKQTLNLLLEVPLQVNKGRYRFKVDAKGFDSLPLTVTVSEQGTFKTEFTTKQSNLQGATTSNFTFEAMIKNLTADNQVYSLIADSPQGWIVNNTIDFKQISSVSVEPNHSKSLSVQIVPPGETKAGTYKVHLNAVTATTSASLDLELVLHKKRFGLDEIYNRYFEGGANHE